MNVPAQVEGFRSRKRRFFRGNAGTFNIAAYALLAASMFYFVVHPTTRDALPAMRDFVSPYSGARCLLSGCNPYNLEQIQAEFRSAGGTEADHAPWLYEPPVYPPSALLVLTPLARMPYPLARRVWRALSILCLFAGMCALTRLREGRERTIVTLFLAMLVQSTAVKGLIYIGQPTAVAIGLGALAYWGLSRKPQAIFPVIALALSLALKPQLAGLIFLALLPRRLSRRSTLCAAALAFFLLFAGSAWLYAHPASRHWRQDYKLQIEGSIHLPGVNDPTWKAPHGSDMINLQAVFAIVDKPAFYNTAAWLVAAPLLLLWARLVFRTNGFRTNVFRANVSEQDVSEPDLSEQDLFEQEKLLALAAIVCLGMLPVYHREYDLPLLLFTFPALALLLRRLNAVSLSLLFLISLLLSTAYRQMQFLKLVYSPRFVHALPPMRLRVLLIGRFHPLLLTAIGVLFLAAMFRRPSPNAQAKRIAAPSLRTKPGLRTN